MVAHARNGAVDVIILVSGDDDLTEAVEEAQVHGVQVIVLAVPNESGQPHGVSRHLQRASDGLELFDPDAVDTSVPRQLAVTPSTAPPPSPSPSAAPNLPTPAQLANQKRQAAVPVPSVALVPAQSPSVAYSATTGSAATIAPLFARTPDEQTAIIDGVVKRVLDTWLRGATEEQRGDLMAGRPSIPRDMDRALLLDLADALDDYDLSDAVRIELRARFWVSFDELEN